MASLKEKIAEARAAGYSEDEIFAQVMKSEKGKEALASGYSEGELREFLGLGLGEPSVEQDSNPVTRHAKIIGGGLARGLGEIVGLPGTLIEGANALYPDDWAGSTQLSDLANNTASGEDIRKGLRQIGVIDRADASPQNAAERLENSIATSTGASLPFLFTGPMATLISGAGAGLGEWGANELMPGNSWASLAGALAGGMLGQSGMRAIERSLDRASVMKELADANLAWDDFERAAPGLLAARESLRDGAQRAATAAHKAQIAAIDAGIAGREAGPKGALANVSDSLAPGHMGWEDAGLTLRAQAEDWLKNRLPKELDGVWSPVDAKVAKNAPVELSSFDNALDSINKKAGSAQALVDVLVPSLPKVLRNQMDKILEGQAELGLPGFTWDNARALRTALGDAMRDPKIMPSVGDQNLKRLYAALTEDLSRTARASGAKAEFDAANIASRELFEIAEGPVAKVLAEGQAPGQMAKGLVSRGVTDSGELETLRRIAPEGVNALAASGIRFGDNGNMLADWTKLSPKAKAALVPDASVRSAIDGAIFSLDDLGRLRQAEKAGAAALRDSTRQIASDDFASWKTLTAEQKLALRNRRDAAAKRAKELSRGPDLASEVRAIKNLGIGAAASYGLEALGINPDALTNSKLGALAAVGVPLVTHGARAVMREPTLLRAPVIAGTSANAMMPQYGDDPMRQQP